LAFSQDDIKNYFRLLGIRLEKDEVERLYGYSEGWVSALYLIAMDYELHGGFVLTQDVSELVYETIYDPLDEELKSFLRSLCLLEHFTLEQAQYISEKSNAIMLLDTLISNNAFITFDKMTGNYSFHNIFGICIREQFRLLPKENQKAIWKKTGEVYLMDKQYMRAMKFFYDAECFDGIMDAIEGGNIAVTLHNEDKELFVQCYRSCPFEVKMNHTRSMLFFAAQFVTQFMDIDIFNEACEDFNRCVQENKSLTKDEISQLLGEYEILQMFTYYNDLVKMTECNERAAKLLKAPAKFYDTKNSFMCGAPSMLYLYYRESGGLVNLIDFIRTGSLYYAKNTQGHGQGCRPLLEAEWLYALGDFENAEIIVQKSMVTAKDNEQCDVELGGMLLLTKIALYHGDYCRVNELLEQMDRLTRYEIKHYQTYWLIYTMDLCKAYIYTCLEQLSKIPDWIFEYEYPKHIQFLSISYANMVYGKALLLKGNNIQVLGLYDAFKSQASIFPNVLAMLTTDIYAAIANYRLSRMQDSIEALKRAMDIAMPDNVVMPFVENAKSLLPVLDKLEGESQYGTFIKKIKNVYEKYDQSVQNIINEHFTVKSPSLTERERQVALLVIEGLGNKEIAAELFISANTVKLELKNIFKKLNINSRVLLKKESIS
jgi:LuxR family maltose regulon positive regulatory protein